jgi:hypothetical protein
MHPLVGYYAGVLASVWAVAAVLVFAYCATRVFG